MANNYCRKISAWKAVEQLNMETGLGVIDGHRCLGGMMFIDVIQYMKCTSTVSG